MSDRVTPHDLHAEKATLGAMLVDANALELVRDAVRADEFFRAGHQVLFRAMCELHEAHSAVDLVTLRGHLGADGLNQAGGMAYISELSDGVPKGVNVVHYAGIVRRCAQQREIIRRFSRVVDRAYAGDDTPDALLDVAQADTLDLRGQEAEIGAYGPAQQWASVVEDVNQAPKARVYLGIGSLDNLLRGVHPGEVCGIMARPSIGKTMLLGHMLRQIAYTDAGAVCFSLEMPAAQICARLARSIYGCTRDELEDRIKDGLDGSTYVKSLPRTVLIDTPGLSLQKMESALRNLTPRLLGGEPPRVVIIDHLGLIGGDRALSTYDRVSTQAREIKELAKRHHVAVLLAIQVNRDIGGDGSKELTLGAARDSGVVEEAMDYLVGCRRLDYSQSLTVEQRQKYENVIFLKVLKNRHGELGREMAVRIDGRTLDLHEVLDLHAETLHEVGGFRSRK